MNSMKDVRVTRAVVYNLSWWRRILLRLTGSSHFGKKQPYPSGDKSDKPSVKP